MMVKYTSKDIGAILAILGILGLELSLIIFGFWIHWILGLIFLFICLLGTGLFLIYD